MKDYRKQLGDYSSIDFKNPEIIDLVISYLLLMTMILNIIY